MELLLKFLPVLGVLLSAVGTLKLVHDWIYVRPSRLRDEYRFSREFIKDLHENPSMHAYQKAKGYQGLAGTTTLTAREIEYILSLPDPVQAMRDYTYCRKYLRHIATGGDRQVDFKPKYINQWARKWRTYTYLGLYFISYSATFAPLLLPASVVGGVSSRFLYLLANLVLWLPLAFISLNAGVRLQRAQSFLSAINGRHLK